MGFGQKISKVYYKFRGFEIVKVYYEFKTRKSVGITGDYVDAGIFWTRGKYEFLSCRADNIWLESPNGWVEQAEKSKRLTPNEILWLHLKAKPLGWQGVK